MSRRFIGIGVAQKKKLNMYRMAPQLLLCFVFLFLVTNLRHGRASSCGVPSKVRALGSILATCLLSLSSQETT